MEPRIYGNKYRILDVISQGDHQNIYLAEEVDIDMQEQFILNEFMDTSMIYNLKDALNEDMRAIIKDYVEYFYEDSNFCIVCSIPAGNTLADYLTSNSLRISDKMLLAENLLRQLEKLEDANRLLKYHLLDLENIMVAPNRSVSFSLNIKFDKDGLYATNQSIVSRLGDILCCVFANTPQATLESDKDSLPPTIHTIARKCKEENYTSIGLVYKDFKASLLYSTFIENNSVDKQIMKNIQKAQRKRSFRPVKRLAMVLVLAALLTGGYYAWNNWLRDIPAISDKNPSTAGQNQMPAARFELSKNKIYVGDRINFISYATDPDLGDSISSYEWSISRNNDVYILFSREENPAYLFEKDGDYIVSLIVKDASNLSSSAYKVSFKVHPKQEIPNTTGTGADPTVRK